jgi:hypothetical protein
MTGRQEIQMRPLLPALVTAGASFVVCVAAFAPWYTTQVAEIFAQGSVSGWNATLAAKIAVFAAVIATFGALAIAADTRALIALSPELARGIVIACAVGCLAAAASVVFRALWIPEPSEFLTRDLGLFVALAASLIALGASVVQVVIETHPAADTPRRGRQ